jgi:Uma2 family endonuclease
MSTLLADPPTELETPPYPVHRFSVAEYHRLVETGLLDEDARVELLEGWIVPKMPHSPLHGGTIQIVQNCLQAQLPTGWETRVQLPVVTDDSEPEPDVAVVLSSNSRYLNHHPSTGEVALVVEVADSSIAKDRRKAALYASIGISAYWIVNLQDRCVEVRTQPEAERRRYAAAAVHHAGDTIELRNEGQLLAALRVDDLFA